MRGLILPGRNEPGSAHPGGAGVSHRERGREAGPINKDQEDPSRLWASPSIRCAPLWASGESRGAGAKREGVRGSRGMLGGGRRSRTME
jgi:hypothetical protein